MVLQLVSFDQVINFCYGSFVVIARLDELTVRGFDFNVDEQLFVYHLNDT